MSDKQLAEDIFNVVIERGVAVVRELFSSALNGTTAPEEARAPRPERGDDDGLPKGMPEVLRTLCPAVGSVWEWEPLISRARARVKIVGVTWNGEDVMIGTVERGDKMLSFKDGPIVWNDLSRWIEAAVLVEGSED